MKSLKRLWTRAALALVFAMAGAGAALAVSPVTREALDLPNCGVVQNGRPATLDTARMLYALGLSPTVEAPWRPWSAGSVAGESAAGESFQYLIRFRQPVTLGAVLTTLPQLRLLKADAPYPGDPSDPSQWIECAVPAAAGPRVVTLEAPVTTRAVLFGEVRRSGNSTLGPVRFYAERCFNAAPLAGARARTEYQAPENAGGAVWRAIAPARGRGSWVSAGVNAEGAIPVPPVSDVNPQWYILAWDEPRAISGLYLQDNFGDYKLDVFSGTAGATPLAGVDAEWKKIKEEQIRENRQQGRWIQFAEPLKTTGLRIRIFKTLADKGEDSPVAKIDAIVAFEDLGTAPVPVVATDPPPPPFKIAYSAPQAGLLTLAIDDAQGRRIRNLIAREPRGAGPHEERWDLADENGKAVAPGAYRWKAITAPELELRYEMSVYPNVTVNHPENSAWLNGHEGPGGWLADHSPPRGGCAADDMLFFGAPCPESGVGFAACDLTGRKLWGIHSFAAWSAGESMATDGKTVFVQQTGAGHYGSADEGADRVWGVDIATRKARTVLVAQNTEQRRRGIKGMAAREGKLYLAINAVDNWLANACGWNAIDLANCRPAYQEARKPAIPYEIVPDSRNDFLRLFRLKGDPPGYGHPDGQGLIWLESTRGPGRRQEILLTFAKPVAIGSCVFPVPQGESYEVVMSVLKPEAPFPPNPSKQEQWVKLERQGKLAWDVAVAPPNTTTRALLISFVKGGEDELADVLEGADEADPTAPEAIGDLRATPAEGLAGGRGAWSGRIEGMRILRRRFENVSSNATVRVNSGTVGKDGVWVAKRTEPLSEAAPAIYMMEWKEPRKLRGVAVKEVDGERTEIDAYTGPTAGPINLEGSANWEKVGGFTSRRRMNHPNFAGHNAKARYLDEMVDFGREVTTRAIRLRVVSQFTAPTREGSCAKDELGLDPTRCRIFGVAPLAYLGGEPPVDATVAERLEVVDGASGKIEREIAIRKPGELAFAPDGTLYAASDGAVVKVGLTGGTHQPLALDLQAPGAMTCDRQGNLYVFDRAPERQVVRVFDPSGKLLCEMGERGGYQAGPWNVKRMQAVTALAVDREGKLWCVSESYWPKRIACWGPSGDFLREYLGPTAYGGGGVLDPDDKRRLFYGPLEFELDWDKGTSRLKNLTWTGGSGAGKMFMPSDAGEVPIRINGRTYLVTRGEFARQACGIVYLYETDHLKMSSALGAAEAFAPLRASSIAPALGGRPLAALQFLWSDRNGDGEVQAIECEFSPKQIGNLSEFDGKLNIQAGPVAFLVKEFLPNGVPVYEEKKLPLPAGATAVYRLDNGGYYRFGDGADEGYAADGQWLWRYKNEGVGVGPDRSCGPYTPAQVVCQFGVVGHETAPAGDLGEFFVINANLGSWNLWTADGLLAGRLFRDLRDGKRVSWSMKEHGRGLRLDDVTVGQEHFQGWFCRSTADGKYYAVAGHNHASVVEVAGLEKFKRLGGEITVTPADLDRTQDWRKDVLKVRSREAAKVLDCFSIEGTGLGKNWESQPVAQLEADPRNPGRSVRFQFCHDQANLYLRYVVRGAGPFKNSGEQWDRLFKSGACADLMLGLQADADPKRRAPVAGDKRVLVSMMKGKPVVVLYEAVVPGTVPAQRWEVVSPTGRTEFDRVSRVERAKVNLDAGADGYTLEVALPLKEVGLDLQPGRRIKLDWGILETDAEGTAVLSRSYWSNKTTSTLADAPTEARLEPDLWGWAIFPGHNKTAPALADPMEFGAPAQNPMMDGLLED